MGIGANTLFVVDDRMTKFLARWIPAAVAVILCYALVAEAWAWPPEPTYIVLGLTLVATVVAAFAYLGSVRGIRTMEDSGFDSFYSWLTYALGWKGLRRSGVLLVIATVAVAIYEGLNRTPSGLLAFFTLPLAGLYQAVTRRYPSDKLDTDR